MKQNKQRKVCEFLMPLPLHIQENEGSFRIHNGITISSAPIFRDLAELARLQLTCNLGGEDILFKLSEGFSPEEYSLKVTRNQIVLSASYIQGAFHGLQTLRQVALANDNIIPCCFIKDKPMYSWRGFMLDCSRHFFSPSFIMKLIDVAALHHLNRFHWHLTDDQGWRFPVAGYPKLESIASKRKEIEYTKEFSYGGFYQKKDIEKIVAYAHRRQMQVIPEIETPGHASALLAAYPNLGCSKGPYEVQNHWGIFKEVMCAGNDEVLSFLDSAIGTLATLFTDPYIHIGGDECPHTTWEQCPACQKRMHDNSLKNENELQAWMITQIAKLVEKHGKRPIGWDEVLDGSENLGLPKNLIVMSWRGVEGGLKASQLGHQIIMSPNTQGCYLDYKHLDSIEEPGNLGVTTVQDTAQFTPCPSQMDIKSQAMVLGGQANLWTEKVVFSRQAEYLLFPRLSVMAERLWNPQPIESIENRRSSLEKKLACLDINCYRGNYQ
ncbi:beta-N-acetylhexosaminidase [uncultured Sphaerochaeta sp.]|uniref:beta-N-acetylhexosaminidase n=1 Tax=uncultured Sphaerochaeta sp. TaxID=886478 RepID=UPI002A0A3DCE|nr:beta-N-acetylhexosaminidase [uncultured Sphaerochaeta sp.]